jgi:hypothetical protein
MHQLVCIKMIELEIYDQLKLRSLEMLQQIKFCEEFIDGMANRSTVQKTTHKMIWSKRLKQLLEKILTIQCNNSLSLFFHN